MGLLRRAASCMVILFLSACGSDQPGGERYETFPVTGQVYIDGAPAEGVAVVFHDAEALDKAEEMQPSATTDKDGNFKISTYQQSDGVPEGDYVLTFFKKKFDMLKMQYLGDDELEGRYSNPKKSEVKVSVRKGEPNDLGTVGLTTK